MLQSAVFLCLPTQIQEDAENLSDKTVTAWCNYYVTHKLSTSIIYQYAVQSVMNTFRI